MRPHRRHRAFTLTELLVVVAIILILVSLLIVGGEAVYSQAMQVKCQHRLEQIGHACQMYMSKHHGMLPRSWDVYSGQLWYERLASTYLNDWNVLACPSAEGGPPTPGGDGGSFDTSSRENVDVLLGALRWLQDKQESDGCWRRKTASSNTGYYQGITGLALLAFFGFGCTDKHPPDFAQTVRQGVEYLSSSTAQYKTGDDAGRFKNNAGKEFYGQGTCTMALCAASRMLQDATLRQKARDAAQLAIGYIERNQPTHGSFGYYGDPGAGDSDTSVCGWCYQAVAAAKVAGLNVTQTCIDRSELFLEYVMDSSGRSTYWWTPPNGGGGWLWERHTPIALTARLLLGHSPDASDCQLQANVLTNNNHHITYAQDRAGRDNYCVYYTTLAMFRMGDMPQRNYWSDWHPVSTSIILNCKVTEGTDMLYWPWETCGSSAQYGGGNEAGEVYSTAIACLTLEAEYEENWINPSWRPAGDGHCSYGYNNRLGVSRRTAARDTIVVMDYMHWEIDHDAVDAGSDDGPEKIAARHSGHANCLFADGRVEAPSPGGNPLRHVDLEPAD